MRGIRIPRLRNRHKGADPPPPHDAHLSPASVKTVDANAPPLREHSSDTSSREYLDVGAVSLIGVFGVLLWMETYRKLNDWIWDGSYVSSHRWVFPVLAVAFSLVVGLGIRYLRAPTATSESWLDAFRGGSSEKPRWSQLPAAVVNSLASLLSGASVGPEAPIGLISMQIGDGYNRLRKLSGEDGEKTVLASAASAFNGLLESPVFTAVLASEFGEDKPAMIRRLPALLIAGAIGYFVFWAVGSKGFAGYLGLQQVQDFKAVYIPYVVVFALIGLTLAILTGVLLKVSAAIFDRLNDRVVLRALAGGIVIAIAGYFVPVDALSGEEQIFTLLNDPTHYSTLELIGLGLLKLALLSLAFRTGFMGGPTFPSIFAATAVGLAISNSFSSIPLIVVLAGISGAQIMALLKAPFLTILFVAFFFSANQNLIALIVVSVATAMVVMPFVERRMARRQSQARAPA